MQKLAATTYYEYIYVSNNEGVTWASQPSAGSGNWVGLCSSRDGNVLAAVASPGSLVVFSGGIWQSRTAAGYRYWADIACSSTGQVSLVGRSGSLVFSPPSCHVQGDSACPSASARL